MFFHIVIFEKVIKAKNIYKTATMLLISVVGEGVEMRGKRNVQGFFDCLAACFA